MVLPHATLQAIEIPSLNDDYLAGTGCRHQPDVLKQRVLAHATVQSNKMLLFYDDGLAGRVIVLIYWSC